ncbi:HEPN-associated N-terminal domain-containing protein [Curtobacterium sp. TXMA1]|uniref:HEPN-associated N-terminal domain-containing protein n=1 Tax=Curtobacterium sp. TXMA1 TaxID=2876939 RepID=UPI001CCF0823|nr:HEPN-associated N-terminal domain-containing protein [Curtobacterium sp. TXMA1]UBQ02763.1 RES domain-containing protein [Curtobacterium sp. TXMA1]
MSKPLQILISDEVRRRQQALPRQIERGEPYIGPVGHAKRYLEAVEERGWSSIDGVVCSQCVIDAELQSAIRSAAGQERCSFCGTLPVVPDASADVDVILALIVDGLRYEYEPPVDQVAWSSRDGGYQMGTSDTADLLEHEQVTDNPELMQALADAIEETEWVQRDPYAASPADALRWGWAEFRTFVKHRRRFTFLAGDGVAPAGGEFSMSAIPAALTKAASDAGAVRVLSAGTQWWRIRPHAPGEVYRTAKELGTPPDGVARDNRMSPKGVGAFYGASTAVGARAEVAGYAAGGLDGTVGQFTLRHDIAVVDLSRLMGVPSLFDALNRHRRAAAIFMRDFIRDVSAVASPSDLQNLEYIPTQIVAEHFRYSLRLDGALVTGLLWSSSKDPSVQNCVIFAPNERMSDLGFADDATVLELDPNSVKVIPAPL